MLHNLTAKKLLSIALSIVWIDFVASKVCLNYQQCLETSRALFFYGVLPLAVGWFIYWAWLTLKAGRAGAGHQAACKDSDSPKPG